MANYLKAKQYGYTNDEKYYKNPSNNNFQSKNDVLFNKSQQAMQQREENVQCLPEDP